VIGLGPPGPLRQAAGDALEALPVLSDLEASDLVGSILSVPWTPAAAALAHLGSREVVGKIAWKKIGDLSASGRRPDELKVFASTDVVLCGFEPAIRETAARRVRQRDSASVAGLLGYAAALIEEATVEAWEVAWAARNSTNPKEAREGFAWVGLAPGEFNTSIFAWMTVSAAVAVLARAKGWDAVALASPWWIAHECGVALLDEPSVVDAALRLPEEVVELCAAIAGDVEIPARALVRVGLELGHRPGGKGPMWVFKGSFPGSQQRSLRDGWAIRARLHACLNDPQIGLSAVTAAATTWMKVWRVFGGSEYFNELRRTPLDLEGDDRRRTVAAASMWWVLGWYCQSADPELAGWIQGPWNRLIASRRPRSS
jgi:hypothetical protein